MHTDQKLVISKPDVMMGKPVIAGTRITVELILEKLAAGESVAEILEAHPRLNEVGIRAALHLQPRPYAAMSCIPSRLSPGIMDEVVLRLSRDAASVLITADKDFGELFFGKVPRRPAFRSFVCQA